MAEDKSKRRPIIDPILMALKSRRVIVALCTLAVGLLTCGVPAIAPMRNDILTLLITLSLAVIGGYTVEDAARAGRASTTPNSEDLRALLKDVLDDFVDEIGQPPSNSTPSA